MATCKRQTKEDIWASSLRQVHPCEMQIRRIVGYTCFALALLFSEIFRRYFPFQVEMDQNSYPTYETFLKSSALMSLSGAGIMLYTMGELSQ
jgi:hypothetical protein